MKGLIDSMKFMSSCHIAIVFLGIFIGACTQRSEMLFLDPYNTIISATPVHQQKTFALDVLFVVESSDNNFSNKNILTEYIEYFLKTLLYQREVIDFHIGFTLASSNPDFINRDFVNQNLIAQNIGPRSRNQVGGLEFFTNENLDEMFPSDVFYVETLQSILGTEINNQKFFDATLRVLTSNVMASEFYRDEANLLLVFIGEDDQSDNTDLESLSQKILELKKYQKDKVDVLSIYPILNKCSSTEDLSVRNVKEFARIFNGHVIHLCGSIFNKLLQAAQDIYQNATSIPLTRIPLLETVALCSGPNMIRQDASKGWVYLSQSNKIALAWDVSLSPPADDSDDQLTLQSTRDSDFKLSCKSSESASPYLFDLTYLSASPANIAKYLLSLDKDSASSSEEK